MNDIHAAEKQYAADPEHAADRAHVLEKIIGFERGLGRDTSRLERVCDALYGESSSAERAAKQRRRAYARAKRAEEMAPFIEAISDAYPEINLRMDWSRNHGRKTVVRLAGVSFGPEYVSSEKYGAGDPDDLLPKLPEIVAGLKSKYAAKQEVNRLIDTGKVRRQGGFAVLSCEATDELIDRFHPFDAKRGGIMLSMAYDSIEDTLATIQKAMAR